MPSKCKEAKISSSNLTVITINAALFGILIAFLSAYAVYFKSVLNEQTNELMDKAGKINEIFFMRSCYFPQEGFDQWAKNINVSIEMEREKLSVARAKEPSVSLLTPPKNSDDIRELGRYLHFLSSPWPLETKDDDFDLGNKKYIPRDSANRGEEIMRIFNILAKCYLFPEAPFETPGAFFQTLPKRVYFKNVDDVKSWLIDLESFILTMKGFKYSMYLMPPSKFLNQLKDRDQKLIESWETSKLLFTFGHLDPFQIKNNFFKNVSEIEKIGESTRYRLNKIENISSTIPSYKFFGYIFIVLFLLFLFGVYIPLAFPSMPEIIYFHIPMISYLILCIFIFFKLFR